MSLLIGITDDKHMLSNSLRMFNWTLKSSEHTRQYAYIQLLQSRAITTRKVLNRAHTSAKTSWPLLWPWPFTLTSQNLITFRFGHKQRTKSFIFMQPQLLFTDVREVKNAFQLLTTGQRWCFRANVTVTRNVESTKVQHHWFCDQTHRKLSD